MGQGNAPGLPVKGFDQSQNPLPRAEALLRAADAGGGDELRRQQRHDAPANVHEGPEGLHAYHPPGHNGAGTQALQHGVHSLLLCLTAGDRYQRRALCVGGDGFHGAADGLPHP